MEKDLSAATFTTETENVVRVTIRGKVLNGKKINSCILYEDSGLIKKFLKFLLKENIHEAISVGRIGGGTYQGYFTVENAERIEAWINDQA